MNKISETLIRPPRLYLGEKVGIVSPGRWMSEPDLESSSRRLEELGFKVWLHPQNFRRLGQLAGTDSERRDAINEVFADPEIRAIILAAGGYGTTRIIDSLDYTIVRKHPKIVMGYSDGTALLLSIYRRTGLICFYGPMLYDLIDNANLDTWRWVRRLLVDCEALVDSFGPGDGIRVLRAGEGFGSLIGGNLSLLVNLLSTPSDFETKGQILFFEDYDERLYRIDRMLVHLKRAGKLSNLSGLLIGGMTNITDDPILFGSSIEERILELCSAWEFPIVCGVPFGHVARQYPLPIGCPARILADEKGNLRFELAHPAVD